MARTKQTARISSGGKAPRKTYFKGNMPEMDVDEDNDVDDNEDITNKIEYDITYDKAFYAHFFNTGPQTIKDIEPRFSFAKSKNPLGPTNDPEYWLGTSFNSKYDGEGIKKYGRPILSIIIAVDVSGSMGSNFGNESLEPKISCVRKNILTLAELLNDNDSFGLVTFNNTANILIPFQKWGDINKTTFNTLVSSLKASGGTDLSNGYSNAYELLNSAPEGSNHSKRIFFMTDMETGEKDGKQLTDQINQCSDNSIYSTVVGVGVDLNNKIIDAISRTPGCNYCNVRSAQNFKDIMVQEFLYTVTPVGFNLTLEMLSPNFLLAKGYGTPEVTNMVTCKKIQVLCTVFPLTKNEIGETRQGIILFKLETKKPLDSKEPIAPIKFITECDNLTGIRVSDEQTLIFENSEDDFFQDNHIRKAILLVRYTDFMNYFIANQDKAILLEQFKSFVEYFKKEKETIGDNSLQQELDILKQITDTIDNKKETATTTLTADVTSTKSYKRKADTPLPLKSKKRKTDWSPPGTSNHTYSLRNKH